MITTFEQIIEKVLGHEGGYVNNPNDPGGETKFGITKRDFPNEDIKTLTRERAKELYKELYWDKPQLEKVPIHLKYIVFDTGVNMGTGMAIKILQRASGATVDGIMGTETAFKSQHTTVEAYAFYRMYRYMELIGRNNNLATFSKGWANRVLSIVDSSK